MKRCGGRTRWTESFYEYNHPVRFYHLLLFRWHVNLNELPITRQNYGNSKKNQISPKATNLFDRWVLPCARCVLPVSTTFTAEVGAVFSSIVLSKKKMNMNERPLSVCIENLTTVFGCLNKNIFFSLFYHITALNCSQAIFFSRCCCCLIDTTEKTKCVTHICCLVILSYGSLRAKSK